MGKILIREDGGKNQSGNFILRNQKSISKKNQFRKWKS